MTYLTVEVEIDHGKVVPREPGKLPETGKGLLTILATGDQPTLHPKQRVTLPIIRGDGSTIINPSSKELDASLWG